MVSYFKGSMKAFFYHNSGLVKHRIVLIIAFATLFDLFVVIELANFINHHQTPRLCQGFFSEI